MHFRILFFLLALFAAPLHAAGRAPPQENALEHRTPVRLAPEEKSHVHMEMRLFLSTVQLIVAGIASNDMKLVSVAAHEAGMVATEEVPAKLRDKLPQEFRKLGQATHQGFDDLSRDADSMGDAALAMKQLGQVMSHCVTCHATYRLETGKR
jgi:hypothetical protein